MPPFHRKESRLRDQSRAPTSCHHRPSPRSESEPSSSRATGQGLAQPAGHSGLGSWLPGNLPEKKTRRASSEPGPFCLSGTGASVGIALGEKRATILPPGVLVPWVGMGRTPARATPHPVSPAFRGTNPTLTDRGSDTAWALLKQQGPRARSYCWGHPNPCPPGASLPLPCPALRAVRTPGRSGGRISATREGKAFPGPSGRLRLSLGLPQQLGQVQAWTEQAGSH